MSKIDAAHGCLHDNQGVLFAELQTYELPSGATILCDFTDGLAQQQLLAEIDAGIWQHDLRRRVQHYGYRYDYKARRVQADMWLGVMPAWLQIWCERLCAEGIFTTIPDQVIINEYQAGQGIAPHVDCIPCFGEVIASLSLGSACVMDFMHADSHEKRSVMLPVGSLLILSGEARYRWKHGISARKSDMWQGSKHPRTRRISLTFRSVIV
ncbi:MAG: alpha-ketoglutarate-dependent dioxygenase AlkB [Alphaproteobacteria bacterium]|nr:MAG: alpha-ketoglutarate-dependent dioxygenase AlkB [Alphaproteobacteria bacterium]